MNRSRPVGPLARPPLASPLLRALRVRTLLAGLDRLARLALLPRQASLTALAALLIAAAGLARAASGSAGGEPVAAPLPGTQPEPVGGGPPAARGLVRIVSPRAAEILSGVQTIEAVVETGQDPAGPLPIEILVDGKLVARLEAPPYRTSFDFGSSLSPRTIRAQVSGGQLGQTIAEVRTRGFDPGRIDAVARVNAVTLYVSVRNASGKYVTDLPRETFSVQDGAAPQTITHFALEQRPLVVAILIDTSFSMRGDPIEAAREAASRFVKNLVPGDRAMIVAFSDQPRVLLEPTSDKDRLSQAIATIEAKGGTALYDAIYTASDLLAREDGRKVIVLLSDGRDEAQSGIEPGSLHTFEEALEKALRSEAILFTIGFGRLVEREMDFYGRTPLKQILERLAADSGGAFYSSGRTSQLKGAYDLIGQELRNQYSLAYSPPSLSADGSWHAIRVEVKDPSLKVFTRRGYYAPKR